MQRDAEVITQALTDRILELTDANAYQALIKERELSKLSESDKALQGRIWQLEDEQKALSESESAIESLKNEWFGLTGAIEDEIKRIRGDFSSNSQPNLESLFSAKTAATLMGDKQAAGELPKISSDLVAFYERTATDAVALARLKANVANSLEDTLTAIGYGSSDNVVNESDSVITPTSSIPVVTNQSNIGALLAELQALRAEIAELKAQDRQIGVQLIKSTSKTADYVEQWDTTGLKVEVMA